MLKYSLYGLILLASCCLAQATPVATETVTLKGQFTGKIESISVQDGDSFKKNQVLIAFNCDLKKIQFEQAKAKAINARAILSNTKRLDKQRSATKTAVKKAVLEYTRANIAVKILRQELAKCTMLAPYDGKVVKLLVQGNEFVTPKKSLIKIRKTQN